VFNLSVERLGSIRYFIEFGGPSNDAHCRIRLLGEGDDHLCGYLLAFRGKLVRDYSIYGA
jgi:hypothetical protein